MSDVQGTGQRKVLLFLGEAERKPGGYDPGRVIERTDASGTV